MRRQLLCFIPLLLAACDSATSQLTSPTPQVERRPVYAADGTLSSFSIHVEGKQLFMAQYEPNHITTFLYGARGDLIRRADANTNAKGIVDAKPFDDASPCSNALTTFTVASGWYYQQASRFRARQLGVTGNAVEGAAWAAFGAAALVGGNCPLDTWGATVWQWMWQMPPRPECNYPLVYDWYTDMCVYSWEQTHRQGRGL